MNYKERVSKLLKPLLDHHDYITIEFQEDSFRTVMANRNPNLLGNFAGGDMAFAANAAAGLQCVADGIIAQTASINVECISRGDGDFLVASAETIHRGSKLIRLRCDVYVRDAKEERLVAIAQINMSPLSDQQSAFELLDDSASAASHY